MKSATSQRIALVLTLLAALAGVVLMAVPTTWEKNEYQWTPSIGAPDVTFVMTGTPDELTFESRCETVRAAGNGRQGQWTVFRTEGASDANTNMSLLMYGDSLFTQFGSTPASMERLLVPTECDIRFQYLRSSNTLTLTVGNNTLTRSLYDEPVARNATPVGTPTIAGFHVDSSLMDSFTVTATTQPSQNFAPPWRIALAVFALLAVACALFVLRRADQVSNTPEETRSKPTKRWTGSDTFVAICAIFGLLVTPPLYDDGWVLTTIRNYADSGFFSNYYSAQAALQPQGFWWATLERIWLTSVDTPVLLMRLPSMILLVLAWWYLRRRVIDQVTATRVQPLARTILATAAVIAALAWAPTLRPEPLVGLLLAVQIVVVYEYTRAARDWLIPLAAVIAVLALTTHQTGWTVATAALALLPPMVGWIRSTSRARAATVLGIAAMCALAVGLCTTFAITDLSAWNAARVAFSSETTHDLFLLEGKRLGDLTIHDGGISIRVFSVGLAILVSIGFLVRRSAVILSPANAAGWAALAGLGGLALTSSKWIWHFGVLLPIIVTLGAIVLNWVFTGAGWRTTRLYVTSAAILILGVISTRVIVSWSLFASPSVNTDELFVGLPGPLRPTSLMFWLGLLVVLALISVALARRFSRPRPAATLAMTSCAVACVVAAVSYTPVLLDSVRNPSTAWPHQVATSIGSGACGIAGTNGLPIATETSPVDVFGEPDLGVIDGSIPMTPALNGVGDTGRLVPYGGAVVYVPTSGVAGPTSTPWFAPRGEQREEPLQTWVQLPAGKSAFDIQWNVAGNLTTENVRRELVAPVWSVVPLTPPEGTTSFRIRWNTTAGPMSVTRPVAVKSSSHLTNIVGTSTVWNNPNTHLMAPCFPMPEISDGRYAPFRYSVGVPSVNGAEPWTSASIMTELACTQSALPENRLCIYKFNFAQMPDLSREQITVQR